MDKTEEKGAINAFELLSYNNLFFIKGKKGVFNLVSKPNKSGMIGIRRFMSPQVTSAKTTDLICLGGFVFFKTNGSCIKIKEVFSNIEENIKAIEEAENIVNAMPLIVPDYDPDKFKKYHAEEVLRAYYFIKGVLGTVKINNQKEAEK